MKTAIVKVLGMLQLLLLLLTSCQSRPSTFVVKPTEVILTLTPTPAPYWDLLPLTAQLEGGWRIYRNDDLNFSFQYPTVHDTNTCGRIWIEDKFWRNPPHIAIGLASINIHIFETWAGDLSSQVSEFTSLSETQMLTTVEPFSISGTPALRLIIRTWEQPDTDYIKRAFVAFEGRLYEFSYLHLAHVIACNAPPLSEEEVYEYLISTVEFNP